ncbi:MAG: efflux RND transporter periplasmic adaptor subunit [Planctomycetes bacterium]|nr:efflux RND transporter periplasmic adaptor subunit [Planctomycetota bacterium]
MLRCKLCTSLTAFVLFALAAASANSLPLASSEIDVPAKPTRLRELLQERAATTRKLLDLVALKVKNLGGAASELREATRLALEAALDACESDQDRVKILQDFLALAKDSERSAVARTRVGQAGEADAADAKAERLRIEIALERAKAGKAAGQPKDKKPVENKNAGGKKVSVQAGVVEAFQTARIFSQAPGVLKAQRVDIGDRVKRGDVLAELDTPDLQGQADQDRAAVDQALARVLLAKAHVRVALADVETAKSVVGKAEATALSAAATLQFRERQWVRLKELADRKAIDESVLHESKHHRDAAVEAENAAKAAVATAKSQAVARAAKGEHAEADVAAAQADVRAAQVRFDQSRRRVSLSILVAPFDGIITQRGHSVGEFIPATDKTPIFTVQRTDLMRVVAAIPERDVPFVQVGNAVEIEIEALPAEKWSAKVSRIAVALDPKTRAMRVEMDVANPTGRIRAGMIAKVAIKLVP